MSWLQKLLPPKIKRSAGAVKKAVPEGLWSKCEVCETVLYRADLDKNLNVCPKCGHHNRLTARERIDLTLDPEGQFEIGAEVEPIDFLKFVDSKRYTERLVQARTETGEEDALIGFAGPRVIEQTVRQTLPEGFQRAEFLLEHGAIDMILDRRQMRDKLVSVITLLMRAPSPAA